MKTSLIPRKSAMIIVAVVVALCISSVVAYAKNNAYTPDTTSIGIAEPIAEISAYTEAVEYQNEELSRVKIEDVITTITLSKKISFSEIENYIEKYDIVPIQLQARGLMPDGTRITIFTRTDMGFEATKDLLLQQAKEDGYEFIGFTAINALVDSCNLEAVQADEFTYLADTTGDAFFTASKTRLAIDSLERNSQMNSSGKRAFPQSLTWDLEDCGIIEIG